MASYCICWYINQQYRKMDGMLSGGCHGNKSIRWWGDGKANVTDCKVTCVGNTLKWGAKAAIVLTESK